MRDDQTVENSGVVDADIGVAPGSASDEAPVELGSLDELENVDFLLEEIENKIAPLALA